MEVTSGLNMRFREEVAEQRPEYPTTHRILELLTCVVIRAKPLVSNASLQTDIFIFFLH